MAGPAEAFEFAASGPGGSSGPAGAVLCVHGFTGSPYEVRYLGEALARRGFHVLGPALAGHAAGRPEELDATTWRDWYRSAEVAFDALRARHPHLPIFVAGLSMGGLVTLHLARARGAELAAAAVLATPVWLPRHLEVVIRAANRVPRPVPLPHVPKLDGQSDIRDRAARRENPTMPGIPVRALGSLLDFMAVVRGEIGGVRVPTLVAHARRDRTAPYACAAWIQRRLGAREIRGLTLERSYHVITIDDERELVARAVGDFFTERLARPAAA